MFYLYGEVRLEPRQRRQEVIEHLLRRRAKVTVWLRSVCFILMVLLLFERWLSFVCSSSSYFRSVLSWFAHFTFSISLGFQVWSKNLLLRAVQAEELNQPLPGSVAK